MKSTEFAKCLSEYLSSYLPKRKNASQNTIRSYCDTFRLFLTYCQESAGLKLGHLDFKDITPGIIEGFLDWLTDERQCAASSYNQRLAALKSFFRYAQTQAPAHLGTIQGVLAIPVKKSAAAPVSHLSVACIKMLLEQPDRTTISGRRDLALLALLYDLGARVQELVDLSIKDVRPEHPAKVRLYGKGRKTREVPLMDQTVSIIKNYLGEQKQLRRLDGEQPLFCNRSGERLTRAGVTYILKKYYEEVKKQMSGLPSSISPHVMRHSKAMHLLQAGINIFYIKDLLGHADIGTTEIYSHADIEMKRAALESINSQQTLASVPAWAKDENLLEWLNEFGKNT